MYAIMQERKGRVVHTTASGFLFLTFLSSFVVIKLTQTLQPFGVTTYNQNGESYLEEPHTYICKSLAKQNGLWDRHSASPIKLYLQCSIKHHSVAFYTNKFTRLIILSEQTLMSKTEFCGDKQISKTIFLFYWSSISQTLRLFDWKRHYLRTV